MGIPRYLLHSLAILLLSVGVSWAQEEEASENSAPPAISDEVFVQPVEVDGE
jgi:hypothetical protein